PLRAPHQEFIIIGVRMADVSRDGEVHRGGVQRAAGGGSAHSIASSWSRSAHARHSGLPFSINRNSPVGNSAPHSPHVPSSLTFWNTTNSGGRFNLAASRAVFFSPKSAGA